MLQLREPAEILMERGVVRSGGKVVVSWYRSHYAVLLCQRVERRREANPFRSG